MNIDFNNIAKTPAPLTPSNLPDASAKPAAMPSTPPDLTITHTRANTEDLAVSSLPPDALSRTDDLGLLVTSAFTLPAPPMPPFPAD